MKRLIIVLASTLLLTLSGCDRVKKEEVQSNLDKVKKSKLAITGHMNTTLTIDYLKSQQEYIDRLNWFDENILQNKKNAKAFAKYISKNDRISELCRDIFFTEIEIDTLLNDCDDSLFDFCPKEINTLKEYRIRFVEFVRKHLSNQSALECPGY